MKIIMFFLFFISINLAFAQPLPFSPSEKCNSESTYIIGPLEPLLLNLRQAGQRIPANESKCGVIHKTDDYWFCIALEQRNCSLIGTTSGYWKCEAIVKKNCGLAQGKDYWFCQSLVQKSCGLNHNNRDMWMCKGILESNCVLNPKTDDFWFCEGVKKSLKEILAPKEEKKRSKVEPYII